MDDRYSSRTLSELKAELKKRNLKTSGRKKELIDRLLFSDRNDENHDAPVTEYEMELPNSHLYKDLHAGMHPGFPPVSQQRIKEFFSCCDKKYDVKIEALYNERYVRWMRCCQPNTANQGVMFVTATVWAEMRKSVSYRVDIKVDNNGVIIETQCECPVGQGPSAHCKHVGCTLIGLVDFHKKKQVLTDLTCTQVLQSFHQVRRHKGSPLKMKRLNEARGRTRPLLYDPRPTHQRNKVEIRERLRQLALNVQDGTRRPLLQLYEPADIVSLGIDHQYSSTTVEQDFLERVKLTSVTADEVKVIEENTRAQHGCKAWKEERSLRLTSSRFGQICKMTERCDIDRVVKDLMSAKVINCKSVNHGKQYESIAVQEFEKSKDVKTYACGLFISTERPYLAASPDRVVDSNHIIEVKCPFSACEKKICPVSVPYLERIDGKLSLKKNHDYYYQVQGQLYCTGRKMCYFVVYTFKGIEIMCVHLDEDFVKAMLKKLDHFYENHFKAAVLNKFLYKNVKEFDFCQ